MATGRADHARFANVPGVIAPTTVTLPRELLTSTEAATALTRHGFQFPLLVRSPGFHTPSTAFGPRYVTELDGVTLTGPAEGG